MSKEEKQKGIRREMFEVNIPVQTLLAKIEEELKLAKGSAKQESLREKVYSIKILCELILDEKTAAKMEVPVIQPTPVIGQQDYQQPAMNQQIFQQPILNQQVFQQPSTLQQGKKIEMDDEANGDSLLDF
ncbi:YwdI family protein [Neobacillus sp. NPDC093127]|uniref:YwdI family protein n=1 Tax=Neobacillus sp. NPDC093127 TaxID=3364296 RepID=UPI0037FED73E